MFILCQLSALVSLTFSFSYHIVKTIYLSHYLSIYLSQSSVILMMRFACSIYSSIYLWHETKLIGTFSYTVSRIFACPKKDTLYNHTNESRLCYRTKRQRRRRIVHHLVLGNKFGFQLQLSRSSEQIGKMYI